MIKVKKHGVILDPTSHDFEDSGVFNPACMQVGKEVHMYYRAFSKRKRSVIGYCRLDGPLKVVERLNRPFIKADGEKEQSIEDPRIVKIGKTYYLTYVAFDGKHVRIAYAQSKNLKQFTKKGIISPEISYDEAEDEFRSCKGQLKERYFLFEAYYKDRNGKDTLLWDKDAILFSEKIKGKYALLHRILPDIQVVYFNDFKDLTLKYWKEYFYHLCSYIVLESKYGYESRNIGGGCPPIKTDKGWLLIYHAVDDMDRGKIYRAGAALLDLKDPTKVIGHLPYPLFEPTEPWELNGVVNNVVFPTGHAIFGKDLYIYYGAADKRIAVASVNLKKLLKELVKYP